MIYTLLIWNAVVCVLYGTDKLCAVKGWQRIKESVLIGLSFVMGGAGALLGMVLFNHKTKKLKFKILVPLAFIVNLIVCYFVYNRIYF